MRQENEILAELIDFSKKYERICREIKGKSKDLDDFRRHIRLLESERDELCEKINGLYEELKEVGGNN